MPAYFYKKTPWQYQQKIQLAVCSYSGPNKNAYKVNKIGKLPAKYACFMPRKETLL